MIRTMRAALIGVIAGLALYGCSSTRTTTTTTEATPASSASGMASSMSDSDAMAATTSVTTNYGGTAATTGTTATYGGILSTVATEDNTPGTMYPGGNLYADATVSGTSSNSSSAALPAMASSFTPEVTTAPADTTSSTASKGVTTFHRLHRSMHKD